MYRMEFRAVAQKYHCPYLHPFDICSFPLAAGSMACSTVRMIRWVKHWIAWALSTWWQTTEHLSTYTYSYPWKPGAHCSRKKSFRRTTGNSNPVQQGWNLTTVQSGNTHLNIHVESATCGRTISFYPNMIYGSFKSKKKSTESEKFGLIYLRDPNRPIDSHQAKFQAQSLSQGRQTPLSWTFLP